MSTPPDLSVVVPAKDEEARIGPTLRRICSFLEGLSLSYEVIVVDDGSRDATARVVAEHGAGRPLRLVAHPRNQGKGAAVRTGIRESSGRRILFSDADLSTDIGELVPFLARADEGADVVIGSRVLSGARIVGWNPWYRILSGRTFNRAIRILALPGVSDTQCGFKLLAREAATAILPYCRIDGFGFDVEILFLTRWLGFRIAEVPITWNNSRDSKVSLLRHTLPMLGDVLGVRMSSLLGHYGARRRQR